MQLSPQQDAAMKAVRNWLRSPGGPQVFYLAGFAGTGKTTLARLLAQDAGHVVYAAFTGKAALVLASKGCRPASTIHSLIYTLEDPDSPVPVFVRNPERELIDADLAVIDEVSMVGEELATDLLSFGKKVLVLGDPAQLPPVKGEGYFTSREPDFMLTEVHRQAQDNPIIRMSMTIREGGRLEHGTYGESRVIRRADVNADLVTGADQVLVGVNRTRRLYNNRIRQLKGYEGRFAIGERVVTLKNDSKRGILNGALWDVTRVTYQDEDESNLHIAPVDAGMVKDHAEVRTHHAWLEGRESELDWRVKRTFQPVDYGYVLSCHKAQGSQWDNVLIFDESAVFRENHAAWLYTAITRAADRVTVVR